MKKSSLKKQSIDSDKLLHAKAESRLERKKSSAVDEIARKQSDLSKRRHTYHSSATINSSANSANDYALNERLERLERLG